MNQRAKIAIVSYSLSQGGLERVAANLTQVFDVDRVEVHLVVVEGEVAYEYSGILKNFSSSPKEAYRTFAKFKKYCALRRYLKNSFDVIVDLRYRINKGSELFWRFYLYRNTRVVYTVHSAVLKNYLPWTPRWTAVFLKNTELVCVCNSLAQQVNRTYQELESSFVYNAIDPVFIAAKQREELDLDFEYILGVSRVDCENTKQIDVLIQAYADSVLPEKGIHLVILGRVSEAVRNLDLGELHSQIHWMGYQANPYKYMARAKFFVLTSKFEGFPMVLIECLATGIPVVRFDCSFGPSEIVRQGQNGLLVPNQNRLELVKALNLLTEDEALYSKCKSNSQSSIELFLIDNIRKQWFDLLKLKGFTDRY